VAQQSAFVCATIDFTASKPYKDEKFPPLYYMENSNQESAVAASCRRELIIRKFNIPPNPAEESKMAKEQILSKRKRSPRGVVTTPPYTAHNRRQKSADHKMRNNESSDESEESLVHKRPFKSGGNTLITDWTKKA